MAVDRKGMASNADEKKIRAFVHEKFHRIPSGSGSDIFIKLVKESFNVRFEQGGEPEKKLTCWDSRKDL
jgi:type II secretory ATPase GspE/PulE/Tfp pilus assembly ATPase PilB-like protein